VGTETAAPLARPDRATREQAASDAGTGSVARLTHQTLTKKGAPR
jgi:hypothetical protein